MKFAAALIILVVCAFGYAQPAGSIQNINRNDNSNANTVVDIILDILQNQNVNLAALLAGGKGKGFLDGEVSPLEVQDDDGAWMRGAGGAGPPPSSGNILNVNTNRNKNRNAILDDILNILQNQNINEVIVPGRK